MNSPITTAPWTLSINEAYNRLCSSINGLSNDEAAKRLKIYGLNTLNDNRGEKFWTLFWGQFKSPVILLLLSSAVLAAFFKDSSDTIIILIIVLISGLLGFWQENNASNIVAELLKLVQVSVQVVRNGLKEKKPTEECVPGDVVYLATGDVIPGDCLLLESEGLTVNEAAFTGESYPANKQPCVLPENTALAKRSNILFMGSHVVSGSAKALVITTGKCTVLGNLSTHVSDAAPETSFERGIRNFGYLLMEITLLLVLVIFAINVLLHKPVLNSFLFSLALAVGLTPQLLPAIISVNLAKGAKKMAGKKVIVKKIATIEDLGSMDILCSDKTGTITEGKVVVKEMLGWEGQTNDLLARYAWLNAKLQKGYPNPIDDSIIQNAHYDTASVFIQNEIPYDFIRKRLTLRLKEGAENLMITKGAVNSVLQICTSARNCKGDDIPINQVLEKIRGLYIDLSGHGYRTLGLAVKSAGEADITVEEESEMSFVGFIVLYDPPKSGITNTISRLKNLGVTLKLITGDNALVAGELARQTGIGETVITGGDMNRMSNAALTHRLQHVHVFAEMEPDQKERIITLLKKSGHVTGFLGDGINDAPALHAADVGISVNDAADVARQAADMVLLAQDLEVLSDGILEGRKTFANTMKYIFMATSANFGNMFSMAGASLLLPFLPLLPKQILLTNLLTDIPEMTIATDHVDEISVQSPQKWDIHFIRRFMLLFGLLSSVFDYVTFGLLLWLMHADEPTFQTGWFTESVVSAVLIVWIVRTRLPFFRSKPGNYLIAATVFILILVLILPFTTLASWFALTTLPIKFYGWITVVILIYLLTTESVKRLFYRHWLNTLNKRS